MVMGSQGFSCGSAWQWWQGQGKFFLSGSGYDTTGNRRSRGYISTVTLAAVVVVIRWEIRGVKRGWVGGGGFDLDRKVRNGEIFSMDGRRQRRSRAWAKRVIRKDRKMRFLKRL